MGKDECSERRQRAYGQHADQRAVSGRGFKPARETRGNDRAQRRDQQERADKPSQHAQAEPDTQHFEHCPHIARTDEQAERVEKETAKIAIKRLQHDAQVHLGYREWPLVARLFDHGCFLLICRHVADEAFAISVL